ncbi:MAG: TetR/AcrR family transcriptional regulator [Thiotrichales bacterium]|nr:TetR/AcrR family transcriptional regulator [Thiotrichales bacterium]
MNATRQQIIDITTHLIQDRGYNAFSYNDVAAALGIRKPSIHYHFPTKVELVQTIIADYRVKHRAALASIDQKYDSPVSKLKQLARLFLDTLGKDFMMCPSGMLATDAGVLPDEVMSEVHGFFLDNETWLGKVLKDGQEQGLFNLPGRIPDHARTVFSSFEGALLAARAFNDAARLTTATRQIINSIQTRH